MNLKALDNRFRTIFSHISGSTNTGSSKLRTIDVQPKSGFWHAERKYAGQIRGQAHPSRWADRLLDSARLDSGEIQQVVDESQQPQAHCDCTSSKFGLDAGGMIVVAPGEQVLDRAQHQRQRRAEFVADIRKENCLGPVQLRQ